MEITKERVRNTVEEIWKQQRKDVKIRQRRFGKNTGKMLTTEKAGK